jgi:hypothetical protein
MSPHPGMLLTVPLHRVRGLRVDFQTQPRAPIPVNDKPMKVARMLAMAHILAAQIATGEYADYQDASLAYRVSKGRISQLLDLTLLAPDIQAQILMLTQPHGDDLISERDLRPIIKSSQGLWSAQRRAWRDLLTLRRLL